MRPMLISLAGSEDGVVYAWKTDTAAVVRRYDEAEYTHPIHQVAFHPYDDIVACCSFGPSQPIVLYYAGALEYSGMSF